MRIPVLFVAFAALATAPWLGSQPQDAGGLKYAGTKSCSTSDCHGADGPQGSPGLNEYKIWKKKDLHAKAFTNLYKKPSKAIAKAMGLKNASKSDACLVCHTKVVEKANVIEGGKWVVSSGVSCEVCHGPSEKWLEPHADPKEKSWDHAKSVAGGMVDLRDLTTWANTCVRCHLKIDPAMIDAGHPRLNFELVDYNERNPPHWDTPNHSSRAAGFNARAWAIGQIVSLREAAQTYFDRKESGAPEKHVQEAASLVKAHYNVLKHFVIVGEGTYVSVLRKKELIGKLDAMSREVKDSVPAAEVLAKLASEAPDDFDSARQVALAFHALSDKEGARASIGALRAHVAAKNRDTFDLEKYKTDLETVRQHFK